MTQNINFIEPSLLPGRDWLSAPSLLLCLSAALALLLAHVGYETVAMRQLVSANPAAAEDSQAQAGALVSAAEQELRDGHARIVRGELLLQAGAGLTDLPTKVGERLRALVLALPETAWLKEVEFAGKTGVRLVGGALRAEAVSGFSARLSMTPAFRGVPIETFALNARQPESAQLPATATATSPQTLEHYGFVVSSLDSTGLKEVEP